MRLFARGWLIVGVLAGLTASAWAIDWRSLTPPATRFPTIDWGVVDRPRAELIISRQVHQRDFEDRRWSLPIAAREVEDLSRALIWLRTAVAETPDDPNLRFVLSRILHQRSWNRLIRAFDVEERCLAFARDELAERRCIAQRRRGELRSRDDRARAVLALEHIRAHHPEFDRLDTVLFELGMAASRARPGQAADLFGALLAQFPESEHFPNALFHLADAEFHAGRFRAAHAHFGAFAERTPDRHAALYAYSMQAWAALRMGEPVTALRIAIAHVAEIAAMGRTRGRNGWRVSGLCDDIDQVMMLAYAAIEGANPTKAIAFFERHLGARWVRAAERLADRYMQTGHFQKAIRLSRQLASRVPEDAAKHLFRIAYARSHVAYSDAITADVEALAAASGRVQRGAARFVAATAFALHRERSHAHADRLYAAYLRRFPRGRHASEVRFFAAASLYQQRRWAEAAERFIRFVETEGAAQRTRPGRTEQAARAAVLARRELLER